MSSRQAYPAVRQKFGAKCEGCGAVVGDRRMVRAHGQPVEAVPVALKLVWLRPPLTPEQEAEKLRHPEREVGTTVLARLCDKCRKTARRA